MNELRPQHRYLYVAATAGFALFVLGVALAFFAHANGVRVAAVATEALGAAMLFPILISFAYDNLRERWLGDEVWRLFGELADGGISRVYKDRELASGRDNAQTRLSEDFRMHSEGPVLMLGVTLRVFFNPLGPFYRDIATMLRNGGRAVKIQALVSNPLSPEVLERANIEEPLRDMETTPQIERDIESSVATARSMVQTLGPHLTLKQFMPAPYCTAIVFPHIAYFSPNILAPEAPVRLPMILFRPGSNGYRMLLASHAYLWNHQDTLEVPLGHRSVSRRST